MLAEKGLSVLTEAIQTDQALHLEYVCVFRQMLSLNGMSSASG